MSYNESTLCDRAYLVAFCYCQCSFHGLGLKHPNFLIAIDSQLHSFGAEGITKEEIDELERLNDAIWLNMKKNGYTHDEQRKTRKKIAKAVGGKLRKGGIIELDK